MSFLFFTFWVLSFVTIRFSVCFFSSLTIWFFVLCGNSNFWVLSQFEFKFLGLVRIWFVEFCHTMVFFSFVTIWVFGFCHILSFWLLSQFEFSCFVTISVVEFCQKCWDKKEEKLVLLSLLSLFSLISLQSIFSDR